MLEFVRVPPGTPLAFPSKCQCGNSKHLLDTHREIAGQRLYFCKLCVSMAARAFGMIAGPEHDKLMDAAAGLEQAEKEISDRDERLRKQTGELADRQRRIDALQVLLDDLRAKALTQKNIIGSLQENTRELASVVGES
jgi:hypothetical protein